MQFIWSIRLPIFTGFVSAKDLTKLTGTASVTTGDPSGGDESLSLSAFSILLSESMKDRYFPKGAVLYQEGEIGNSMLFINSGKLEVSTKDEYKIEVKAGNFVGEGYVGRAFVSAAHLAPYATLCWQIQRSLCALWFHRRCSGP
jgi:Cyclic nucleotide-binding domain